MPAFGDASGQSLLGEREALAARYRPVRDVRKRVRAVELGICMRHP